MNEGFTKRKINTSKYLVGSKTAHVKPTHHQCFCPFLLLTGATSERQSANSLPLKVPHIQLSAVSIETVFI
jgi:hypothetical protein